MIPFSQRYERFEDPDNFSKPASVTEIRDVDNEKLMSFEEGYQAGWDDATAVRNVSNTNLHDAIVENLQEISFGFHEAKSGLIRELRPLLEEVLDTLVPEVIKMSIGPFIVENIMSLASEASDQSILTEVSVADFPSLKTFLQAQSMTCFELKEQESLMAGQVIFKVGGKETEIDFEQTLREIKTKIDNLFEKA